MRSGSQGGEQKVWGEGYAFGRILSPLVMWLAMAGLTSGSRWKFVPFVLMGMRIWVQFAAEARGIFPLLQALK